MAPTGAGIGSAFPLLQDQKLYQTLVLLGGILGLVVGVLMLSFVVGFLNMGGPRGFPGFFPDGPFEFMGLFAYLWAVASLVFPVGALYAYGLLRQGNLEQGGVVATVIGVIMCFTNWVLSGVLVLVGGLLAWNAARAKATATGPATPRRSD